MTNAEIIATQRAAVADAVLRKTIISRILAHVIEHTHDDGAALLSEAARHLKWYEAAMAQAHEDAKEAARDARDAASMAYADGRESMRDYL